MNDCKATYNQIKGFLLKWIENVGNVENLPREVVNAHFKNEFEGQYDYLMLQLVCNELKIENQFEGDIHLKYKED